MMRDIVREGPKVSVWIALWIIIGMSWLIDVRDRSKSWFWLVIVAFHLY